jgi:hypothetical protein
MMSKENPRAREKIVNPDIIFGSILWLAAFETQAAWFDVMRPLVLRNHDRKRKK